MQWWSSGEPFIWLNAAAVSVSVIAVIGLLLLLLVRGFGHFWPAAVLEVDYRLSGTESVTLSGQVRQRESVPRGQIIGAGIALDPSLLQVEQLLLQVGNRDINRADFRWLLQAGVEEQRYPDRLMVVERRQWGNLYGYLKTTGWDTFQQQIERVNAIYARIQQLEKSDIAAINYQLERLRLQQRGIELGHYPAAEISSLEQQISRQRERLAAAYSGLQVELDALNRQLERDIVAVVLSDGSEVELPLANVVRAYRPNQLSTAGKLQIYLERLWEFISGEPREANTEGGIFPAIFGTVLMVLLMSVLVTPFGILAAVYLREYAHQGFITRVIRIAVNNLAGVPAIVYGVFGLGFFVYTLGGNIDQLFFSEGLPAPTFGTPGLFWASLTLALLTLPVVIVATEEGLARLPASLREGSLALGATRLQTITRVVLPSASPALMTGVILAVARAAGEVAPLMLVGVVKLAPTLPLDGNFPFLHLERKFMHLGFHIYDVGFQSPNVEAARPLVYATALLLVAVIIILNLTAIRIRNRLRESYRDLEL